MPTDLSDPTTWVIWFLFVVAWSAWFILFFFPHGFTRKEKAKHNDEVEYQKWIRGRTGETWDQKAR